MERAHLHEHARERGLYSITPEDYAATTLAGGMALLVFRIKRTQDEAVRRILGLEPRQ